IEVFVEGGIGAEEACAVAKMIEAAGLNAITVSAYHATHIGRAFSSSFLPMEPAALVPYAAAVRKAVSIPVIALGQIDVDRAEQLVRDETIDFVAMGRKLLADPDFARKVKEGRAADIRPCINCYIC